MFYTLILDDIFQICSNFSENLQCFSKFGKAVSVMGKSIFKFFLSFVKNIHR